MEIANDAAAEDEEDATRVEPRHMQQPSPSPVVDGDTTKQTS